METYKQNRPILVPALKKKMCIKLDPEKKVVASWAAMGGAGGRETLLPNRHFSVSGYFV